MHNGESRRENTGHERERIGRTGAGVAGQSSARELAHRSSAIYASGWKIYRQLVRCDAVQRKRLHSLTGCALGAISTVLSRPIFRAPSLSSPSHLLASPWVLICSRSRLIHIYCSHAYVPSSARLLHGFGARFLKCAINNGMERGSFMFHVWKKMLRLHRSICEFDLEDNLIICCHAVRSILHSISFSYSVQRDRSERLDSRDIQRVCAYGNSRRWNTISI